MLACTVDCCHPATSRSLSTRVPGGWNVAIPPELRWAPPTQRSVRWPPSFRDPEETSCQYGNAPSANSASPRPGSWTRTCAPTTSQHLRRSNHKPTKPQARFPTPHQRRPRRGRRGPPRGGHAGGASGSGNGRGDRLGSQTSAANRARTGPRLITPPGDSPDRPMCERACTPAPSTPPRQRCHMHDAPMCAMPSSVSRIIEMIPGPGHGEHVAVEGTSHPALQGGSLPAGLERRESRPQRHPGRLSVVVAAVDDSDLAVPVIETGRRACSGPWSAAAGRHRDPDPGRP
jgi:hypothetical protein